MLPTFPLIFTAQLPFSILLQLKVVPYTTVTDLSVFTRHKT
jgi:hypothetical protein